MMLYYIDESEDQKYVLSAIGIPSENWNEAFKRIKDFRLELRNKDGIRLAKELHARDFVAGRGRLGPKIVTKGRRAQIFKEFLLVLANMKDLGVECINVYLADYRNALDRLINRIQKSLETRNSQGILIFDEGQEIKIRRTLRRMRVFNPIPSKFGGWPEGKTKNIPVKNIIADPFFKRSCDDYFIQAADFVAYALLRKEEPTAKAVKYNLHEAFYCLQPILNIRAHEEDPYGIVRR